MCCCISCINPLRCQLHAGLECWLGRANQSYCMPARTRALIASQLLHNSTVLLHHTLQGLSFDTSNTSI